MQFYSYANKGNLPIIGLPAGPSESEADIRDAIGTLYPEHDTDEILSSLIKREYYTPTVAPTEPLGGDAQATEEG